jgi:hypothetical protein
MPVRDVHPLNAFEPIVCTLFPTIVTLFRPVQPLNASDPIDVTVLGIVIPVNWVQLLNADDGIAVIGPSNLSSQTPFSDDIPIILAPNPVLTDGSAADEEV